MTLDLPVGIGVAAYPHGTTIDSRRLSESLQRVGIRPPGSRPLIVERGWPLPKIPLVLLCSEARNRQSCERWWSFYLLGAGKMPYSCREAIRIGRAIYLSDLNAVVSRFPNDPLLINLDVVRAAEGALSSLNRALADRRDPWHAISARVLGYKPSRRLTVELELARMDGRRRTVYAKLFPEGMDHLVEQVQRTLERELVERLSIGLELPPILGRIPAWNAVVWERVPQTSLLEILPTAMGGDAVRKTARALTSLHGSSTGWRRRHERARELRMIESWVEAVARFDRELSESARPGLHRLVSESEAFDQSRLVPSHRDFYDKQVLVGSAACTLLDLEFASLAEAELDVGNFMAHLTLRELQGRIDNAQHLAEVFTAEYRSREMTTDWQLVNWYRAGSLLRLACVYALRESWSGLAARLMAACNEVLAGQLPIEVTG